MIARLLAGSQGPEFDCCAHGRAVHLRTVICCNKQIPKGVVEAINDHIEVFGDKIVQVLDRYSTWLQQLRERNRQKLDSTVNLMTLHLGELAGSFVLLIADLALAATCLLFEMLFRCLRRSVVA